MDKYTLKKHKYYLEIEKKNGVLDKFSSLETELGKFLNGIWNLEI